MIQIKDWIKYYETEDRQKYRSVETEIPIVENIREITAKEIRQSFSNKKNGKSLALQLLK